MNRAIGVIDSGIGGLTVVKEMLRQLPKEEILYIGDTARCPYGPRPQHEVRQYTWEMINYLLDREIKMLVIACNTATAVVLEEARNKLNIPVVGVIHPGAISALKVTKNDHVGVIGTLGTIQSDAYHKTLLSINNKIKVESIACPLFVPLVEQGIFDGPKAYEVVSQSLEPLKDTAIDTLILGCTHYPLLSSVIQRVMGENIEIISSGDETAREVSALLYHKQLLYTGNRQPNHTFFTSGEEVRFKNFAKGWLETNIPLVTTISLT
ncbi:glutamate racemase [Anaerobacillus isosaccharinicus]|uniref:Glutamate racemase n=1 Tax=Anaerobacillus isosaccharinicus TaxID=1532552 RepID=A0A1S2ME19_9BACI|nr:glutamate racemase [Anaerobacillus isosaccharinicus]MBA5587866.1 glutamate racemase [Anaerobacillus isosaccharinicus]QOY33980.1 glutamate racemase [Anaerobacillus isosaccharinicus]